IRAFLRGWPLPCVGWPILCSAALDRLPASLHIARASLAIWEFCAFQDVACPGLLYPQSNRFCRCFEFRAADLFIGEKMTTSKPFTLPEEVSKAISAGVHI